MSNCKASTIDLKCFSLRRSWRLTSATSKGSTKKSKLRNTKPSANDDKDKSVADSTGTASTRSTKSSIRIRKPSQKSELNKEEITRIRATNFIYLENLAAQRQEEETSLRARQVWKRGSRCNNMIKVIEPSDDSEIMHWLYSESQVQTCFEYNACKLAYSRHPHDKDKAVFTNGSSSHSSKEIKMKDCVKRRSLHGRFTPVFRIIAEEDDQ